MFTLGGVKAAAFEGQAEKKDPLPKGDYVFMVSSADIGVAKKDGETPVMTVVNEVVEPEEYAGRKLWRTFTLTPAAAPYTIKIVKACGIGYDYNEDTGELSFEESDLVGCQYVGTVKHRPYMDQYKEKQIGQDIVNERAIGDSADAAANEPVVETKPAPAATTKPANGKPGAAAAKPAAAPAGKRGRMNLR
jgi:hypothetical protein